jgi:hypothetical protein
LLRLQRSADADDVWLDARRTLESYGLAAREQLEYRILERAIDVVSCDGRASRSVMVSERERVGDMVLTIFRVVPELVVHAGETQTEVVKLEPDVYLAHYSLPLAASFTLLSSKPLTAAASDDDVRAHVALYALLPSFEGELRVKTSGGLRKWQPRFFSLQVNQLLVMKQRGDRKPLSTTSALDARSARRADPSECSDRRRHGCAVRLDTVHGALVMEATTVAEADRVLTLLSKWIALGGFFRNRYRFATVQAAPSTNTGTIVLDPMVRSLSSPRISASQRAASSLPQQQQQQQSPPVQQSPLQQASFFGGGDDEDDEDAAPLPDDLSTLLDDAGAGRSTLLLSNASAMMASRATAGKAAASTMRNIEIANELTVAITLSDDVPIHSLVPIIAKQVKSDNITPLTSADLATTSPIVLLDHCLTLGAHQLPFDASLSLKDNTGNKPGVRDENRYAASNLHVLVFARLPSICERVAVRKGVSKVRLWLELCGMHLRCYTDTSAAAIDEMSTLRSFKQQVATLRRGGSAAAAGADGDFIDKIEYIQDDFENESDDGRQELNEIAQVEKELAAMKNAAALNAAAGTNDERGALVGELHVSNIEFVSTDVKSSKSFKLMLRRPPLHHGLLPSRALAPPLADNADLSYTFVCDDVEVKLDWYELLNDWLPFFQSYRDTEVSTELARGMTQSPRGLLGEEIYTADEFRTYQAALAAATQKRHIAEVSLDPHDDTSASDVAGGSSGRKVISRTGEPLAAARPPPTPAGVSTPPSNSPVLAPNKPNRVLPAPVAAAPPVAAAASVAAAPSRAPSNGAGSLRRVPTLPPARSALPGGQASPRPQVQSNYVKIDSIVSEDGGSLLPSSPGHPPPLTPSSPAPARSVSVAQAPPPLAVELPLPVAVHPTRPAPVVPPVQTVAPGQTLPPPPTRGPQAAHASRGPPARQPPPVAARSSPTLPPARSIPPARSSAALSLPMLPAAAAAAAPATETRHYDSVPAEPTVPGNKSAYRTGKPKFNVPPGDGTHEDPQRQSKFKELVKTHNSKYGWYAGALSRQAAEARLKGQAEKTVVVRDSSVPHCLALSYVAAGKVVHVVLEFWDCEERRGWCKEDGKTIAASVSALLATLDFVDMNRPLK